MKTTRTRLMTGVLAFSLLITASSSAATFGSPGGHHGEPPRHDERHPHPDRGKPRPRPPRPIYIPIPLPFPQKHKHHPVAPVTVDRRIRDVDFETFSYAGLDDNPLLFRNGIYYNPDRPDCDECYLEIEDVEYVELLDNDREQAVITIFGDRDGRSRVFEEYTYVFDLVNEKRISLVKAFRGTAELKGNKLLFRHYPYDEHLCRNCADDYYISAYKTNGVTLTLSDRLFYENDILVPASKEGRYLKKIGVSVAKLNKLDILYTDSARLTYDGRRWEWM